MYTKLALLNMKRHLKRTILILFAVAVSVLMMEVIAGLFAGFRSSFFRNLSAEGAHGVVHALGWEERLDPFSIEYTLNGYPELIDSLAALDGVEAAEPVLSFGALLLSGEDNYSIAGRGILPRGELYHNVREGVVEGSFLPGGGGILLSRSTADLMDLSLGDEVSLLVEDSTGSPYYLTWNLTGIFDTGAIDFDNSNAFISHDQAEELLYLDGATTEIRIRLAHPREAESFLAEAEKLLDGGVEVTSWKETQGSVITMLEAMDVMILFMDLLVVIVVASLITNALLMNIFDRLAEFGTLRAIGLKRGQLIGMVLAEGGIQGLAGALAGIALGLPVVLHFSRVGIDFGAVMESMGIGSSRFFFAWEPANTLTSFSAGVAIALAGSLYAALTAAKMSILDNLAQN